MRSERVERMKKTIGLLLACAALALFAGCANSGISIGFYIEEGEEGFLALSLQEDQTFQFAHMAMSNWPIEGSYTVRGKQLTLSADADNRHVFAIKEGKLVYSAAESSAVLGAYSAFDMLEDGMVLAPTE